MSLKYHFFYIGDQLVIVDKEDEEFVNKYKWEICTAGVNRVGDYKLLHRLVTNTINRKHFIKHKNNNKFDCRKQNLQITSSSTWAKGGIPKLLNNDGSPRGIQIRNISRKSIINQKIYTYKFVVVTTCNKKGKQKKTMFSVNKHGLQKAVKKAIKTRIKYLIRVNKNCDLNSWDLWDNPNLEQAFFQSLNLNNNNE